MQWVARGELPGEHDRASAQQPTGRRELRLLVAEHVALDVGGIDDQFGEGIVLALLVVAVVDRSEDAECERGQCDRGEHEPAASAASSEGTSAQQQEAEQRHQIGDSRPSHCRPPSASTNAPRTRPGGAFRMRRPRIQYAITMPMQLRWKKAMMQSTGKSPVTRSPASGSSTVGTSKTRWSTQTAQESRPAFTSSAWRSSRPRNGPRSAEREYCGEDDHVAPLRDQERGKRSLVEQHRGHRHRAEPGPGEHEPARHARSQSRKQHHRRHIPRRRCRRREAI